MSPRTGITQESKSQINQYLWLIRVRWFALIAALAPASLLSYLNILSHLNPLIVLLVLGALLNLVYFFILKRQAILNRFGEKEVCLCQILTDIMGVLAICHFTGGLTNPFIFFVSVPVIVAGIFFRPWWTYLLAFLAWGLSGLMGLLEANGVLTQHDLLRLSDSVQADSLQGYRSALLLALGCFLFSSAYLVCKIIGVLRKRTWQMSHLKTSMQAYRRGREAGTDLKRVALGGFVQGIDREVKNPIGIVRARVDSMQYDLEEVAESDHPLFADLEVIKEKMNQMEKTVDKVTAFFGFSSQEKKRLDLASLLEAAVGAQSERLAAQQLSVRMRIAPGLPPIKGAESELNTLFVSLLQNAMEALEGVPGGAVSVHARLLGRESDQVIVRIRDNGPGIAPGIMDRIFDPFFSTRGEERGMGLAVAYTIVRNHGGEMRIRSRPPPGTAVTILLPALVRSSNAS